MESMKKKTKQSHSTPTIEELLNTSTLEKQNAELEAKLRKGRG